MSYIIEKLIPTPEEIISKYSLSNELKNQIKSDREAIINIIENRDNRKLLIIGPCSAWPNSAVISYCEQLKEISNLVSDKIKIIIRVYTQKPRTALGWTGPANQIDPFKPSDIEKGIIYCRKMMLSVLELGFPIADEALFTHNQGYFSDLLSWIAIGARSSEDQEHRIFASMINHPVGLKNPSSGNLNIAINSIISAQNSHVFLLNSKQIKSNGNTHSHLVLRGGNGTSNIYYDDLLKACNLLQKKGIINPSIIVDCSHDNSIDHTTGKKNPLKQGEVLLETLDNMHKNELLFKTIKGFMIESFIKTGNQNLNDFKNSEQLDLTGLSITDSCIGIEKTKKIILELYNNLN